MLELESFMDVLLISVDVTSTKACQIFTVISCA